MEQFKCIKDIADFNDSMELDSGQEVARYVEDCWAVTLEVCGHVRVYYKDDVYKAASQMPDELLQLFHEGKADAAHGVEVDENNWFEMFVWYRKEDGRLVWSGYSDVVDWDSESEEELRGSLKDALDEYISDFWLDRAHKVLDEEYPDADANLKDLFACEHWQNCVSDEQNCKKFEEWIKNK